MATPNYKGPNQPTPNGSGWLGSWGGGTPAYISVVKKCASAAMTPGASAAMTPDASAAQAALATGDPTVVADSSYPGPIAIVIPRDVIDPQ
jgi:hypothetical protein